MPAGRRRAWSSSPTRQTSRYGLHIEGAYASPTEQVPEGCGAALSNRDGMRASDASHTWNECKIPHSLAKKPQKNLLFDITYPRCYQQVVNIKIIREVFCFSYEVFEVWNVFHISSVSRLGLVLLQLCNGHVWLVATVSGSRCAAPRSPVRGSLHVREISLVRMAGMAQRCICSIGA